MAGEEQTVGSKIHSLKMEDTYTSNIQPDIIKGWNDRRQADNVELTSLVPFVQLIGVFNATEYERMFGHNEGELSKKPVYFIPDPARPDETVSAIDYIKEQRIGKPTTDNHSKDNLWEWIQKKLESRFIDLFVYEGVVEGKEGQERSILTMTPMDGIMMAEYKSQAAGGSFTEAGDFTGIDSTGGIGITDLQVDYGKSNALGSRKLNMRLTVNEPAILDEFPEYAKLSTMQGEFIIIYGWSNPQIIDGFDATPPPLLLPSTAHTDRNMMIIGLDNMDTGGYWSAVKLNVTSYDFSFNEMGQLEINVGFMDKTSMMMNTTRISTIASTWKKIMGTGDYDPASTPDDPTEDFTQVMVTLADDTKVPVADLVANEQNATSVGTGSTPTGEAPVTIEDLHARRAVPFLDSLAAAGEEGQSSYTSNKGEYNQEAYWAAVKKREKLGFPYGGPGIRSYEKITVMRPVQSSDNIVLEENGEDIAENLPDGEVAVITEETTAYRVKVVYYYLGWVLEAMRLSLNSQNRSRVREGNTSFNPQFKYLKNESTSKLKSAFQSKVDQTDRAGSQNERLQSAIIRLKEYCMPPFRGRGLRQSYKEVINSDGTRERIPYWPRFGATSGARTWSDTTDFINSTHKPCAGQVVVEEDTGKTGWMKKFDDSLSPEKNVTIKQIIANKIFPTPEGVPNVAMPMRGHRIQIDPGKSAYDEILTDDEQDVDAFWVFKPDWYLAEKTELEVKLDEDPLARDAALRSGDLVRLAGIEDRRFEGARTRIISVVPAGGSTEGFNPINPTSYKAADRGGRFFYKVVDLYQNIHNNGSFKLLWKIHIVEVDEFRQADTETWQLTQRKWYNLYVTYLGNYFSYLMKNRLDELEREGRTVEDIYNEPLDLDFLTSKVFNNWNCASGSESPSQKGGNRWSPATWDQIKRAGVDPDLLISIDKTELAINDVNSFIDEEIEAQTNLTENIVNKLNIINNLKDDIEELTGGRYDIGQDAGGNTVLVNFKNWKEIALGSLIMSPGGEYYEKISKHEDNYSYHQVKLEWIIWKKHGVPTDNWYSSPLFAHGENMQSNWKNQNPDQLKDLQIEVETQQAIVDKKIVQITANEHGLESLNNNYLDMVKNIDALNAEVERLTARLSQYQSYTNEENEERELSPYDDTSSFDDVLEIDMGRSEPMRLTTKVAQQWYKRFTTNPGRDNGQGWNWLIGVRDITNYGPRRNGLRYMRPSNKRAFQFDLARRNNVIKGNPRTVFDLEDITEERPIHLAEKEGIARYSWRAFGDAGVPNDDGRNGYGFYPGDREIDEDTGINIGGDHVANYDEFLDLFGLLLPKTITGLWPRPGHGGDIVVTNLSAEELTSDDAFYYMIDEANNVIMPAPVGTANEGWFVQTGWYLGYGGDPVYLYPSQQTAVQIDRDTGEVTRTGNANAINPSHNTNIHTDITQARSEGWGDDRMAAADEGENWRAGGVHYRIGENEHNLNLTLDEKRTLVLPAGPRTWLDAGLGLDYPGSRGSTPNEFRSMGKSVPSRGAPAPGQSHIGAWAAYDWDRIGGVERIVAGITIREDAWNAGGYNLVDGGVSQPDGKYSGTPDGQLTGPLKIRGVPKGFGYTNLDWPYGTGYYHRRDDLQFGSHTGAERAPNKNYLYIGDLLEQLPNKGFFTTVNNDNYSPSVIGLNGKITDGKELNQGFVDFIIQNIYAPIGKNRRIATVGKADGTPERAIKVINVKDRSLDEKWRENDTTYGHLFRPIDNEDTLSQSKDISFTDFALKSVESVADMPIRRDIVDNLMNKNNTNMSLAQFIQEIIHPGAIGINTGNIHVSIRQKAAGNFEVFQATKNWKAKAAEVNDDQKLAFSKHKYPTKHFLIDYKHQDSLIENIDMSSKFDPAMSLTYERGAAAFAGNPTAIVKFLAYGTVAEDLREFLNNEDTVNNTQLYGKVFNAIGTDGESGEAARIIIAQNAFFDSPGTTQNKIVSNNVIAKFLMQKPERMNKLNALIQSEPGENFATQLLSHYMRRCTITIHGTTNLTPFNSINISGVLPNLEGLYLITSMRESVTTQNFQTIIEAVLLRPKTIENLEHEYTP